MILLSAGAAVAHAQQFAVKTNALFDVAMTPDIGFELVTGEHSSVALSAFGHWKPYGLDSRMITVQPEYRFWFNGRPMVREYIGGTIFGTIYDMTLGDLNHNGYAVAAGVTGGYVFPLGKRWNFELSGGFGVLFFRERLYRTELKESTPESSEYNSYGYKLFPVKLAATFIYIIK